MTNPQPSNSEPLNLLKQWEQSHFRKIARELRDLNIPITRENIPAIIQATSFQERSKRNPNECPYYEKNHPCHNIENLNCLLCACPNYQSDSLEGGCKANSPQGKYHYHENLPKGKVGDCSDCQRNHTPQEVQTWLEENINILKQP